MAAWVGIGGTHGHAAIKSIDQSVLIPASHLHFLAISAARAARPSRIRRDVLHSQRSTYRYDSGSI